MRPRSFSLKSAITRLLPWVAVSILTAATISLGDRGNPDVSFALVIWGVATYASSRILGGVEERSMETKMAFGLTLILLVGGSAAASANAASHILGYSSPTDSLLGWVGFTCFILGFGVLIIGVLLFRSDAERDDYGGLLPAQQSDSPP